MCSFLLRVYSQETTRKAVCLLLPLQCNTGSVFLDIVIYLYFLQRFLFSKIYWKFYSIFMIVSIYNVRIKNKNWPLNCELCSTKVDYSLRNVMCRKYIISSHEIFMSLWMICCIEIIFCILLKLRMMKDSNRERKCVSNLLTFWKVITILIYWWIIDSKKNYEILIDTKYIRYSIFSYYRYFWLKCVFINEIIKIDSQITRQN